MLDYTNKIHNSSTAGLKENFNPVSVGSTTQIKGSLTCNKAEGGPTALLPVPPPDSKTGVEKTKVSVDWVGVTFPPVMNVWEVLAFIGAEGWTALPHGQYGYRSGYVLGHIKVYYDGSPTMGVHLSLCGKGCKELPFYQVFETWPKFIGSLLEKGCAFSRLDVAGDDFAGRITKDRIQAALEADAIIGRNQVWNFNTGGKMRNKGKTHGWTYYFGSRQSETYTRIYDKAAESGSSESFHWVRFEVEFKGKKAQKMAEWLSTRDTLEGLQGIFSGVLDFKEVDHRETRLRWRSASWWADFIEDCAKVCLLIEKVVETIEKKFLWWKHSVAPTYALLLEHIERLTEINDAVELAPGRWSLRHRALLPVGHRLRAALQKEYYQ